MIRNPLPLNLATNVLNFACNALVGLWLIPFLIRHLGVAAYGLIPLATTLTAYLAVFTLALNAAVSRFLTQALDRGDALRANQIFNTSFWGSLAALLVLAGPSIWLAAQARHFLAVPAGLEQDFFRLLLAVIGVFCLTTLASVFSVSAFCRNRLDLSNWAALAGLAIRVGVIVWLFRLGAPRVWHVGAGYVAGALAAGVGGVLLWRRLTPQIALRPALFDQSLFAQLAGLGGWVVVNQFGALFFLGVDLLVVNRLLGADATGRYGALLNWTVLLRSFAGVVAGVFAPPLFLLQGRGDRTALLETLRRAMKFLGLVVAVPVGVLCGLAAPLLRLWLGAEFEALAPLLVLMTAPLCINLAVWPLFHLQVAANRVRWPGLVTCAMGVLNLVLALALAGPAGWGLYGVAAAGALTLTAKNLIFTPLYAASILGAPRRALYRDTLPAAGIALLAGLAGWVAAASGRPMHSWPALAAAAALLGLLAAGAIWTLLLDSAERRFVLRLAMPWRAGRGLP